MNTMFALYFWLMQILGVPTVPADVSQNASRPANPIAAVPPPPPQESGTTYTGNRGSSFISNGF